MATCFRMGTTGLYKISIDLIKLYPRGFVTLKTKIHRDAEASKVDFKKMMNIVINVCAENWMWIVGGIAAIFILGPTLFWGIATAVVAIYSPDSFNPEYSEYWGNYVRVRFRKPNLVEKWLGSKIVRLLNLITLQFIWGYILFLIGYGLGKLLRLVFVKGIWRALCAIGRGISRIYRAI